MGDEVMTSKQVYCCTEPVLTVDAVRESDSVQLIETTEVETIEDSACNRDKKSSNTANFWKAQESIK